MASKTPAKLKTSDARKTYRYLRIGMIVTVGLLAVSIAIEYSRVDCLQPSISAYYYTPVQAIFVGGLMAIGLALIVIKGRTRWEDISLNVAGMLAPVVAVAPTTDVTENCGSLEEASLPMVGGKPAEWLILNVENNFYALLIAGAVGLVIGITLALVINRGPRATMENVERGTRVSLAATGAVLLFGWWAFENWDDFYTRAHGAAAFVLFLWLIAAVAGKAWEHREKATVYYPIYATVAVAMLTGGGVIQLWEIGGRNTTFVLEAFELAWFALFWIVQTVENWDEEVTPSPTGS